MWKAERGIVTAPAFTLTVQAGDVADVEYRVVVVSGEVDVTNAADFVTAVRGVPGPRPLILELSEVRYLDSVGFAALDRLLADRVVVVVLDSDSAIHPAATLMGVPCHETINAAIVHCGRSNGG
jgi:anti-sigma B factor antagonist